MSRSRKKHPSWVDRNPFMKNYANRRLRRKPVSIEFADGGSYKKFTCSYDISDYRCVWFNDVQHRDYCEKFDELPYKSYMK